MSAKPPKEGMKCARLFMVLSSISPLFILWAIRGNNLIPDLYFSGFCVIIVVVPNVLLLWRERTAVKLKEKSEKVVGSAEDHREHVLVYLFAMLLPFYTVNLSAWREMAATLVALAFIVFLFWHLNLHYMNLIFAARGYRVFTVYPPEGDNPIAGRNSFVVITNRSTLKKGERLVLHRFSDTVYMEIEE